MSKSVHSCPVLPTNVLDSSDSLTLSFQSWEDPGFLGHPRILPSCPSHTAAQAVSEDSLDILGSSLGVLSETGPHAVWRIPWTSRDPPLVSPLTQAPMLSGGSLGHPEILPWDPIRHRAPKLSRGSRGHPGILLLCLLLHRLPCCQEDPVDIPGSSLGVPPHTGPHAVHTSVMIYHRGANLSKQHSLNTLIYYAQSRICHTQVDMLMSLHQR